jgi:uncharacterized protein (DUF433 family)
MEALTNQPYFEQIIMPFLRRIDYDEATDLATRWHIEKMVVVDPAFCFGKPIVEAVGITTHVLASSYFASNGDARAVARWFEVEEAHVNAAVDFETKYAA